MLRRRPALLLPVLLAYPLGAHAADLELTPEFAASFQKSTENRSLRIIGGKPSKTCHWPSTALLISNFTDPKTGDKGKSLCSGTLVHPEILITAAHCNNEGVVAIAFTDSLKSLIIEEGKPGAGKIDSAKLTKFKYCKSHTSWSGQTGKHVDFAYCRLEKPRTDLQITPIAMGCELEAIKPKLAVTPVGFGRIVGNKVDKKSQGGTKYEVETIFQQFSTASAGEAIVGENGKGLCNGDSGGPVFFKLPEDKFGKDAGWRVFGVTSWGPSGPNCNGPAYFGMMNKFVEFVEKDSGIDITPCTDAKGNWKPTKDCKQAPLDPYTASGDWEKGCVPAKAGGWIASCGDPFSKDPLDTKAPEVEIKSPSTGDKFEAGDTVKVTVEAKDDSKIAEVVLVVDGDEKKADEKAPYEWELKDLEAGKYEIYATAKDEWDNKSESKRVKFEVEEDKGTTSEPGEDTTGGETSTGDKTGVNSDDTTGTESKKKKKEKKKKSTEDDDGEDSTIEDDDSGGQNKVVRRRRGCAIEGSKGGEWALLGVFGLLGWRRRRSRR